ncbi:hypothetical protein [Treponema pectinovorum]|uniref:hypothetical protein n=1 Tax=Treponema pectinovorum TaxID=164 RepID=UPI0011CB6BD8|nr:hypothetical protein [Treponema pectinovorum]
MICSKEKRFFIIGKNLKSQKKHFNFIFLALLFFVFTQPFFAQENENSINDKGIVSGQVLNENSSVKEESKKNDKNDSSKLTQEQKAKLKNQQKQAKLLAKEKAKQKTDKYLGTVYVPQKNYEIVKDDIKLSFRAGTGTFSFYAFDSQKKQIPLFSQYSDSISTSFFAKVDGTIYRLNKDAAVKKELRKIPSGAQLVYNIAGKTQIAVQFEPISSFPGKKTDIVKVSIFSTNIFNEVQDISVKAVIDTILGEGTDFHFVTTAGNKISSEKQFSSFKQDRSIISTDGKTSLQIVLDGKSVSSPEQVSFSEVRSLLEGPWVPVIVEGRSFNSAVSYNNSAVSVNWASKKLKKGETSSIVFYFATGLESAMPEGLSFIDYVLGNEENIEALKQDSENPDANVDEKKLDNLNLIKKPDIDFIVPPITQEQLDPVYVQNLINRINSLQSDPALVDFNEIRLLNAELDSILERIRRPESK